MSTEIGPCYQHSSFTRSAEFWCLPCEERLVIASSEFGGKQSHKIVHTEYWRRSVALYTVCNKHPTYNTHGHYFTHKEFHPIIKFTLHNLHSPFHLYNKQRSRLLYFILYILLWKSPTQNGLGAHCHHIN